VEATAIMLPPQATHERLAGAARAAATTAGADPLQSATAAAARAERPNFARPSSAAVTIDPQHHRHKPSVSRAVHPVSRTAAAVPPPATLAPAVHIQPRTAAAVPPLTTVHRSVYPATHTTAAGAALPTPGSVLSGVDPNCTFRPKINHKSAALVARSLDDMSRGDADRALARRQGGGGTINPILYALNLKCLLKRPPYELS
jgi:hypothetical protein